MSADADKTSAAPAAEDVKAKMREALAAKQKKQHDGQAHLDGGDANASPHGPVDAKRVYRRKTG